MTRMIERLRRAAGAFVFQKMFSHAARIGGLHPRANPARYGVERIMNLAYKPGAPEHHHLDVYTPAPRGHGAHPVVLYVHGGGFRILSKDTHWMMALAFARRGFVVFNINYRLAPEHPYPAALEDAASALLWVHANAARFGGDPERIVLAGESAGANLVTSLAIAMSWRREEPFARALFDSGIHVRAVVPACGMLQASDGGRFARRRRLPTFISDRITEVSRGYLGRADASRPGGLELADPVVVLENAKPPERPLPPMFTFVGTKDPVLDDTRRLHAALTKLGSRCEVTYYPGELHAFHAMVWRPSARDCWKKQLDFLREVV